MHLTAEQRKALGTFLRARREALAPAQFGLSGVGRRRTPGLHREEVAQLAGLSTTWYSWLEQGRDMSMSAAALSRLADALSLNGAERTYLFELSRHRDPRQAVLPDRNEIPVVLRAAVDAVLCPAYAIDRLWCVRAWNAPAEALLRPWLIEGDPNLIRYMFLVPSAQTFVSDWEARARRLVAEFRADMASMTETPAITDLLSELSSASADFRRMWHGQHVLAREGGLRRFNHPDRGQAAVDQLTFAPIGLPDHRLIMLLPA